MPPTTAVRRALASSLVAIACGGSSSGDGHGGTTAPGSGGTGVGAQGGSHAAGASSIAGVAGVSVAGRGGGPPGGSNAAGGGSGASAAGAPIAGQGGAGGTEGGSGASGMGGAPVAGQGGNLSGGGGGAGQGAGGSGAAGTGAGGSNAGASGAGVGGAPVAGQGGSALTACQPTPIVVEGAPSGMVRCADGSLARVAATHCVLADLSAEPPCPPGGDPDPSAKCHDPCVSAPYGRPRKLLPPVYINQWQCVYTCTGDADCPAGTNCACALDGIGTCLSGGCDGSAACGAEDACRVAHETQVCGDTKDVLRCVQAADTCASNQFCSTSGAYPYCGAPPGKPLGCNAPGAGGCGRPLVVGEGQRLAPLVATADWCA